MTYDEYSQLTKNLEDRARAIEAAPEPTRSQLIAAWKEEIIELCASVAGDLNEPRDLGLLHDYVQLADVQIHNSNIPLPRPHRWRR